MQEAKRDGSFQPLLDYDPQLQSEDSQPETRMNLHPSPHEEVCTTAQPADYPALQVDKADVTVEEASLDPMRDDEAVRGQVLPKVADVSLAPLEDVAARSTQGRG